MFLIFPGNNYCWLGYVKEANSVIVFDNTKRRLQFAQRQQKT